MKLFENEARQGDIEINRVASIPKGAKKANTLTIAHGEVTGHSHRLVEPEEALPNGLQPVDLSKVDVLVDETGLMYVALKDKQAVTLKHDEHGPVTLTGPGTFCFTRQREYDENEREKERKVRD